MVKAVVVQLVLITVGCFASSCVAQTCHPPLPTPDPTASTALDIAIRALSDHVSGALNLTDNEIVAQVTIFSEDAALLPTSLDLILSSLDLIDDYEEIFGPLFIGSNSVGGFSRTPLQGDGKELERAILIVQQGILDEIYHGSLWSNENPKENPEESIIEPCASVLRGRKWLTSAYFPGAADPPVDNTIVHLVQTNVTMAPTWGNSVAFSEWLSIRPLDGKVRDCASHGRISCFISYSHTLT